LGAARPIQATAWAGVILNMRAV